MKKLAIAGCCAVVSILTAGCGSSAKTASSSPTAPSAASSKAGTSVASPSQGSTSASAAVPSKDKLATIVVQPGDLPAGWTSTPSADDSTNGADDTAFAKCVGTQDTQADVATEVSSPDFGLDGATVSSTASSYKTQAAIDADIATIKNPKAAPCYEALLKASFATSLPAGSKVQDFKFAITPGSAAGPTNVAGTGSGTITVAGSAQAITVYIAVAFITGPLTESQVDVINPTKPIPAAFFAGLTKAVATRTAQP